MVLQLGMSAAGRAERIKANERDCDDTGGAAGAPPGEPAEGPGRSDGTGGEHQGERRDAEPDGGEKPLCSGRVHGGDRQPPDGSGETGRAERSAVRDLRNGSENADQHHADGEHAAGRPDDVRAGPGVPADDGPGADGGGDQRHDRLQPDHREAPGEDGPGDPAEGRSSADDGRPGSAGEDPGSGKAERAAQRGRDVQL